MAATRSSMDEAAERFLATTQSDLPETSDQSGSHADDVTGGSTSGAADAGSLPSRGVGGQLKYLSRMDFTELASATSHPLAPSLTRMRLDR